MEDLDERNRRILRRTLSFVSWLFAGEHLFFVQVLAVGAFEVEGPVNRETLLSLMALHLVMLGAAGWSLWKPRSWAWTAVLYAAVGAAVFAGIMASLGSWGSAGMYAVYVLLTAGVRWGMRD